MTIAGRESGSTRQTVNGPGSNVCQLPIIGTVHLSCPYDFRIIYIGSVVDPFIQGVVFVCIPDKNELASGHALEALPDPGSFSSEVVRAIPSVGPGGWPLRQGEVQRAGKGADGG